MTFGALTKGQRFRVWRHAGTGGSHRRPPGPWLSDEVYTKVTKGACTDSDGEWLNVLSGTSVQLVGEEQER